MSPQTSSVSSPHPALQHAAVMVCTRERPDELDACLSSLATQQLPPGLLLTVCIADNNPTPIEHALHTRAKDLGLHVAYGHEPERGYASVRNTALTLALGSGADVVIFIDDDSEAEPHLIAEHISAMERYNADVIVGHIEGVSLRTKEGERMSKAGTGNVSMRRWIVDPVNGKGLTFDPQLNLLGFEDFEFFREVTAAGGKIYRSLKPVTKTLVPATTVNAVPTPCPATFRNLKNFATMEGRNEIVATRLRHGWPLAAKRVASRYAMMMMHGSIACLDSAITYVLSQDRSRARGQWGRLRLARFVGAVGGLYRPGYDRTKAKLGELIEVSGTGLRAGIRRSGLPQRKRALAASK